MVSCKMSRYRSLININLSVSKQFLSEGQKQIFFYDEDIFFAANVG